MSSNGLRLCACGCGQQTTRVRYSDSSKGLVAGEYRQWIRGHNHHRDRHPQWRGGLTTQNGYTRVNVGGRYANEHVRIAEAALGHPLPARAVVHHVNEQRDDNRQSNLVICQDRAYHMLLHARLRALRACGHADWRKCRFCQTWNPTETMRRLARKVNEFAHRECISRYRYPKVVAQ